MAKQLTLVPLTLREANLLIELYHRHHSISQGYRFSIGVKKDGLTCAAAIVGRPVHYKTDYKKVAEVTRLVSDGTPHTCSMLYAASARACEAMGFHKIQTFILESEPGTSLKAAGWSFESWSEGGTWNRSNRGRNSFNPIVRKQRWVKYFCKCCQPKGATDAQ